jgi:hypothetical protein
MSSFAFLQRRTTFELWDIQDNRPASLYAQCLDVATPRIWSNQQCGIPLPEGVESDMWRVAARHFFASSMEDRVLSLAENETRQLSLLGSGAFNRSLWKRVRNRPTTWWARNPNKFCFDVTLAGTRGKRPIVVVAPGFKQNWTTFPRLLELVVNGPNYGVDLLVAAPASQPVPRACSFHIDKIHIQPDGLQ